MTAGGQSSTLMSHLNPYSEYLSWLGGAEISYHISAPVGTLTPNLSIFNPYTYQVPN